MECAENSVTEGKLDRLSLEVVETHVEADDILSYVLVSESERLPAFTAGAHLSVFLPSGLVRQFSLANDPQERDRYVIAVQRESAGRGGTIEMHDRVGVGCKLSVTAPINNFPLRAEARRHVLIAGGIGVTPIVAMAKTLQRQGASWSLHYCARSLRKMAFREEFGQPSLAEHTAFYYDDGDPAKGLNISELLSAELSLGTHVYCCGPQGMMKAVRAAGHSWPAGTLHFEYFTAENNSNKNPASQPSSEPFEVELASSGRILLVPAGESILSVLEANGIEVPSLCTEGICGTCIVDVLEGEVDHRDVVLDEQAHAENKRIAICCSRARGKKLKLAL